MLGALLILVVFPFIPGAAPLMFAAALGGFGMAALFASQGMYADAAPAVAVALFAVLVRALRLRVADGRPSLRRPI